jgi:phage terminase small subunit
MVSSSNLSRVTKRQERFCREYIIDMNGKEAAIRAGYKRDNAKVIASNLLAQPEVRFLVAKLVEQTFQRLDMTAQRVLFELSCIAFSNAADFTIVGPDGEPLLDMSKMSREQMAAIAEYTEDATGGQNDGERRLIVRRKIKLHDKVAALGLLGKHFKLFVEKHEHGFTDNVIEKLREGRQRLKTLEHK